MIISIDKTHSIFSSKEYLNDIVSFNVMEVVKQQPMMLESNEKDFIIGQTAPDVPVWVWTSDLMTDKNFNELCQYFYGKFQEKQPVRFVAKPLIASAIAQLYTDKFNAYVHRISMESYENPKPIPFSANDVAIQHPGKDDVKEIAVCMANFENDSFHTGASPDSFLEKAEHALQNPYFFIIKQDSLVASIAQSSRETDFHMAINQVYTKPEFRGRGFAAALTYYISDLIMKRGKIPTLYTDLSNPYSNKAYKKVGFVEKGKIDEITITWDLDESLR